jgi:hypothetical protein
MKVQDEALAAAVIAETTNCLKSCVGKIKHCLEQLTDEQVWWRPDERMNAIGNLILHLCGNLRQWFVSGIGGAVDVRNRPQEFSERTMIPKAELLERLHDVARAATEALSKMTAEEMLKARRIRGLTVSGLGAIFDAVPHFRGHVQEIIWLTRMQLGDRYEFDWVPSTVEQGAAISH